MTSNGRKMEYILWAQDDMEEQKCNDFFAEITKSTLEIISDEISNVYQLRIRALNEYKQQAIATINKLTSELMKIKPELENVKAIVAQDKRIYERITNKLLDTAKEFAETEASIHQKNVSNKKVIADLEKELVLLQSELTVLKMK